MAVSFDEFAVAWFVSGLNKTVPVIILEILQGNVDPQINAIGTFVFHYLHDPGGDRADRVDDPRADRSQGTARVAGEPMSEPLVVFENVVKRFGAAMAVERLNLEIYKGEFLAIMGSSGCGKTTTLRMLAGLEQPSEGEVRLAGRRMNEVSAFERDTPSGVANARAVSLSERRQERRVRSEDARHGCRHAAEKGLGMADTARDRGVRRP